MDLSPNDIRNYEFPNQMRGYDKEEVDNLLEQVAVALEEARQQNLKLSMEVDSLKTQLAALKEFEDTIKNAAIDARRNADSTIANAKKEAEEMLEEAKQEAKQLRSSHERQITDIEQNIAKLEQTKRSYISELRGLMNSHLDMVDEIATADIKKDIHGDDDSGSNGLEVTDSADMTRQKIETLASQPDEEAIKTEEANAPEVVAKTQQDQPAPKPQPKQIDPELAVALEQYKKKAEKKAGEPNPEDFGPAPPQGTIVETNKRAEDVPPGFIAKIAEAEIKAVQAGGKATANSGEDDSGGESDADDGSGLAPDAQDRPTEHNAIDMDRPSEEDKARAKVSPDDLAEALDGVVSKFEEEMDKAEKS